MVKSLTEYKQQIEKALKSIKKYNKGLDMQVTSLATALMAVDKAQAQIEGLVEVTVLEETRYGYKYAMHPVFKVLKDQQDSVTRQLKALGLTPENLTNEDEEDPLVGVTKKVIKAGKKPRIIKPKKKTEQ
ncbi:MAG: hypothetical protein IK076_08700 [Bacteroidales bacterium]|nr:hypothetical protein [Bacteroidales bacterium]